MTPRLPLMLAVVTVTGCHDAGSPTAVEFGPHPVVLSAISDMIGDPLVIELVASIGDQRTAEEIADLLAGATAAATDGDANAVWQNLFMASNRVMSSGGSEDGVLRAALMFLFDEARLSLTNDE